MDTNDNSSSPTPTEASDSKAGRCAVATGSVAGDQLQQPVFERCRALEDAPELPESERLAFLLGWRWAEKGKPRLPNPFAGIDRDLELMWDAGWHEGEPQNRRGCGATKPPLSMFVPTPICIRTIRKNTLETHCSLQQGALVAKREHVKI